MTKEEIKFELDTIIELWKKSQFQEALSQSFTLCNIVEDSNEKYYLSNIYNTISNIYADLSNFQKAIEFCNKSISLNTFQKDEIGLASNYSNIGIIHAKLGNYSDSLEYFEQSLTINEKIENYVGIANVLGNIGGLYIQLKEFNKALEYYEMALQVNQKINERDGIASNLGNIANVFSFLSQHEKALEFNQKALKINNEVQNKRRIALNLGNIGNCFIKFNNYQKGLEYLEQAKEIYTELGSKEGIAINLSNIAFVLMELKEYTRAEEVLNSSYSISVEINFNSQICKCYELYSFLYEQINQFEDAFRYHKKFTKLKDELISEEANKKAQQFDQRRKIEEDEKARQLKLARFQEQERIFHNILPISIADRLIDGEHTIAESFDNVSIFFSDIIGFTTLSATIEPAKLVRGLNTIFTAFDRIGTKYGLEKIKTIGDAYMAVCGVPTEIENHSLRAANFALEAIEMIDNLELGDEFKNLKIRIGLHCGSVVAGIIGEKKFAYDVWGDAVNIASRMESNSEAGRIHVSEQFASSIESNQEFTLLPRGEILVKGKGSMKTFWLEKGK